MIKTINGSGRTWEMRFSIFNLGWATTRNRFNKLFIGTWLSGLTSKFRATADRREGPSQLMVDSTKVTSLKAPTGNWAKRIPTATASTRPASSLSSLLTSDQTQSISHSLLFVDTLSLRDLAAMATKSRQTFFHYVFFFNRKLRPLPHPRRNDWKVTSLAALSDSTQIVFSKTLKCLQWERHPSARTCFVLFF